MKHFGPAATGTILLGAMFLAQTPAQAVGVHSLEMNLRYYNFSYEEDISGGKSTEQTWIPDLEVNYYYQGKDNPFYGRVIIDYGDKSTDYDGSTQGGMPLQGVTDNVFITTEANFGYGYANDTDPIIAFVFYTGIGQRYWERDIKGEGGYVEDYTLRYIPVGIRTLFTINNKWNGAVDISNRFTIDGDMKAHLGRIGYDDATFNLGHSSSSWKFEVPFLYKYSERWNLAVTPWYEIFKITKSDPVTFKINGKLVHDGNSVLMANEPSSDTKRYGMNLGVNYSF